MRRAQAMLRRKTRDGQVMVATVPWFRNLVRRPVLTATVLRGKYFWPPR